MNNKHESLFCCGRRGKNYLILQTTQFFFQISIVFLAMKLLQIHSEFALIAEDQTEIIIHSVLLIVALVLLIILWFFFIPDLLTTFTIVSNVSNSYPIKS